MKVTKYTFDPLSSYYQHPYIKGNKHKHLGGSGVYWL
jgi:hypothetical protein